MDSTVFVELPPNGSRDFIVKLPSPVIPFLIASSSPQLTTLQQTNTLAFWREYVDAGRAFNVPDQAVNQLFRASLWHALRLPRRHTAADGK